MILSDYRLIRNSYPKRTWLQRYFKRYSNAQVLWGERNIPSVVTSRSGRSITIRGSVFLSYITRGLLDFDVKNLFGVPQVMRMNPGFVEFILKSKTIVKI